MALTVYLSLSLSLSTLFLSLPLSLSLPLLLSLFVEVFKGMVACRMKMSYAYYKLVNDIMTFYLGLGVWGNCCVKMEIIGKRFLKCEREGVKVIWLVSGF